MAKVKNDMLPEIRYRQSLRPPKIYKNSECYICSCCMYELRLKLIKEVARPICENCYKKLIKELK